MKYHLYSYLKSDKLFFDTKELDLSKCDPNIEYLGSTNTLTLAEAQRICLDENLFVPGETLLQSCKRSIETIQETNKMPKVKKPAEPVFAIGTEVVFDNDGTEMRGVVKLINTEGEYEVLADDDGQIYICAEHEISEAPPAEEEETPKKKTVVKGKPSKGKPQEEEEPKKGKTAKGTKRSLADEFKELESQGPVGFLDPGDYEALVSGGGCEVKDDGKMSAWYELTVVNDENEENNGKTTRRFFNVTDEDGKLTQGSKILKGDLEVMEFEEDDFDIQAEDYEEYFTELLGKLKKKLPWVLIRTREGKGGFLNTYLQGLCENQEDKPELPEKE